MWKLAVSMPQSRRKKRYWTRIGWVARKVSRTPLPPGLERLAGSTLGGGIEVRFDRLPGGKEGREGEDGVAFSMRAHVR